MYVAKQARYNCDNLENKEDKSTRMKARNSIIPIDPHVALTESRKEDLFHGDILCGLYEGESMHQAYLSPCSFNLVKSGCQCNKLITYRSNCYNLF